MSDYKLRIKEDGKGKYLQISKISEQSVPTVKKIGNERGIKRIKCSYISEITKHNLKCEGFSCEICN